jgi:putative peptidoglycan lipid II flippase
LKVDASRRFGKWGIILGFSAAAIVLTIVAMASEKRHPLLTDTIVTSAGTLTSRVLGFVRDMATAALFGLTTGGVLDALVVAFRIPNLFRALFGEGAMTASFLPVFTEALEHNREHAWQILRDTLGWLCRVLFAITIIGEIVLGLWAWLGRGDSHVQLLAGLSAIFLPYLIVVCITAVASAALQALGRFAAPAFSPALLNICWIIGALWIAPSVTSCESCQAYVLAMCVVAGGLLPGLAQWLSLRGEGFRLLARHNSTDKSSLKRIQHGIVPTTLALAVTQLNTLSDSIVAWVLAAPADGPQTISWLGNLQYPMQQGAAATIYFGERFYQFPLGLIGIAVATVVFPRLSKHSARGDKVALATDLNLGLSLVLWLAVPSAVGLVVLAEPITRLLFERGQFTPADTLRAARMIAAYGAGVWAYCALPVLIRGFYAVGDRVTPLRVAVTAVVVNLVLDFSLIWPFAEIGLAVATVVSAIVQLAALAFMFSRRYVQLNWHMLCSTLLRSVVAAAAMAGIIVLVLGKFPVEVGIWNGLKRVLIPTVAGMATYAIAVALSGRGPWRGPRDE